RCLNYPRNLHYAWHLFRKSWLPKHPPLNLLNDYQYLFDVHKDSFAHDSAILEHEILSFVPIVNERLLLEVEFSFLLKLLLFHEALVANSISYAVLNVVVFYRSFHNLNRVLEDRFLGE